MSAREVLDSWKAIASYLGRDIRTCRRWEEHLGLPVHRLDGSPKARVRAYKDEIDRWLETKLHEHDAEHGHEHAAPPPSPDLADRIASRLASLLGFRQASPVRRLVVVASFALIPVLGVLGWRTISNGRPHYVPSGGIPALAVLPFINSTGEDGLNYLRESVPDHLIRDLQRNAENLTVFSFGAVTDAIQTIGLEPGVPLTPSDLYAIASRTGAEWFLVSYLSKSGSKLRADYELRDAASLLASSGASPPPPLKTGHVAGTEAEIASVVDRVADSVRRAFGIPTQSEDAALQACTLEATRFYETARVVERKYTMSLIPADLEKMIDLMNQARKADPGCALAVLGLGDAYQHKFVYGSLDPEPLRLMKEHYRRANEMAPERAETNVGVGWIHFIEGNNDQAYAYFKKAVELDRASLHVLFETGAFLRSIGLLEQSADYFTRVIRAGGTTADVFQQRAWDYEHMGLYESALGDYDKMIELDPLDYRSRCWRARVLVLMKRFDAASAELAVAETLQPGGYFVQLMKGLIAAAKGDRKTALEVLAAEPAEARVTRYSYFRSRIYAALGMKDEAIRTIETGIAKGFADFYDYFYFFPYLNNNRDYFYDPIRRDPRFLEILRREELKYSESLEKYTGL